MSDKQNKPIESESETPKNIKPAEELTTEQLTTEQLDQISGGDVSNSDSSQKHYELLKQISANIKG
jgi:hypothetical protein